MKQTDYSIEFARIFTDQEFGDEQRGSISLAREVVQELQKNQRTYGTYVLIYDYNPKTQSLAGSDYIDELDREGLRPNYWAYESTLAAHCREFLKLVTERKVRKSYERYTQEGHSPCSLLTAIWYAIRLGKIEPSTRVFTPYEYSTTPRLINVLPRKYEESEQKTLRLLRAANIDVDSIETRFFGTDDKAHYVEPRFVGSRPDW